LGDYHSAECSTLIVEHVLLSEDFLDSLEYFFVLDPEGEPLALGVGADEVSRPIAAVGSASEVAPAFTGTLDSEFLLSHVFGYFPDGGGR
jgi:hypothetical protein